ncbi:MAG TPA: CBS domain-containing protein [Thermodesulfobacteriota bacterium]
MIAASVMTTEVLTIQVSASMLDALKLAHGAKVRQIPVVDENKKVVGVITPRALLKGILPKYVSEGLIADLKFAPELPEFVNNIDSLAFKKVENVMEKDFIAVSPETSSMEVATLLLHSKKHAESVLVVDDRKVLLGIISPWDIFKRLWDYAEKNQ